jgi:hypothetical protein
MIRVIQCTNGRTGSFHLGRLNSGSLIGL